MNKTSLIKNYWQICNLNNIKNCDEKESILEDIRNYIFDLNFDNIINDEKCDHLACALTENIYDVKVEFRNLIANLK